MTVESLALKSDCGRCLGAMMLSVVLIAAGGAQAKNHDAQRIQRQASDQARHDRATGPLEASNDRLPD